MSDSPGVTGPFERSERLLDSRDYRRVMRRGRRRSSAELVVVTTPRWVKPNKSNTFETFRATGSRLGITASRKFGGAVIRNRFKRRVREWFRHRRGDFESDLDLVVIARKPAARLSLSELDDCLSQLLRLAPAASGPSVKEPV